MMRVSTFLTVAVCGLAAAPLYAETETVPETVAETVAGAQTGTQTGAAAGTSAGAPPAYPDFTFKRVAAPQTGQGPKITVQIDPAAQAAYIAAQPKAGAQLHDPQAQAIAAALPAAAPVAAAQRVAAKSGWDWFWSGVSPARATAGPANVAQALRALDTAQNLSEPRLQTLQNLATAYGRHILAATVGTDVSPALVLALISVESSGLASAESHKGAQGLMQLIPDTAARFGVEDATDPAQNIRGGVAYLAWLLEKFDRDPILALAGYNAGEGAVLKHDGVPPFAETRAYVPKVLAAWRVARGLCQTRPELISDGCVFTASGQG